MIFANVKLSKKEKQRRKKAAEETRLAREKMLEKYKTRFDDSKDLKVKRDSQVYRRETKEYPSLSIEECVGSTSLPEKKVYTGTKLVGIATMHKSNMVPVFSKDEATEISKMRRG